MRNMLEKIWNILVSCVCTTKTCVDRPLPKVLSGDLVLSRATGHVAVVKYSFINPLGETMMFVSWLNGWNEGKILKDADVIKMT